MPKVTKQQLMDILGVTRDELHAFEDAVRPQYLGDRGITHEELTKMLTIKVLRHTTPGAGNEILGEGER